MSVKDYQEYEKTRMEKEVKERIHDAPVLKEYITAYLTMKPEDQFFFNEVNILAFKKTKSDTSREQLNSRYRIYEQNIHIH